MKKLGIIGGMGPAATMYFASRVVDLTHAKSDQEHLDITMLSRPWVPDRSAFIDGSSSAAPFCPPIVEMAIQLEGMGCGVLCMPCNTAHAELSEVENVLLRAKMVSMPDSVARVVADEGFERIGILATTGTRKAQVYEKAFVGMNVQLIWPEDHLQTELMKVIYRGIKQGLTCTSVNLDDIFKSFLRHGCEAVVIGCTELSMMLARDLDPAPKFCFDVGSYLSFPTIDALDVLALRCVQECGAKVKDCVLTRNHAIASQSEPVYQDISKCNESISGTKEVCACAG